jgi:hypothetical protein
MSVMPAGVSTGPELIAHYAAIKAKRLAMREPAPTPKPQPKEYPQATLEKKVRRKPGIIHLLPDEWFPESPPPAPRTGPPTIQEITKTVCTRYRISRIDIQSKRRTANIVRPRQVAMYLARMLTLHSLPEVGRRFGGRDHTTVLHAVNKIAARRDVDRKLNADLLALELELCPPPVDAIDPNQMALPFAGEGAG